MLGKIIGTERGLDTMSSYYRIQLLYKYLYLYKALQIKKRRCQKPKPGLNTKICSIFML